MIWGWLLTVVVTYALGQSVQWCSPEGICIALTIPGIQSSADGPDLYVTLKAPAEYKWFAIGFGEQMEGTLMLVNWPWNNKVVVSPRLATYSSLSLPLLNIALWGLILIFRGHSLPPPYSGPEVTVLNSSVTSTDTIVELKCSNCTVWTKGKLDISSQKANFIYAYSSNAPAQLSNVDSSFQQHDDYGNFQLNLVSAVTTTAPTGAPAFTISTSPQKGLSQHQIVFHSPYLF